MAGGLASAINFGGVIRSGSSAAETNTVTVNNLLAAIWNAIRSDRYACETKQKFEVVAKGLETYKADPEKCQLMVVGLYNWICSRYKDSAVYWQFELKDQERFETLQTLADKLYGQQLENSKVWEQEYKKRVDQGQGADRKGWEVYSDAVQSLDPQNQFNALWMTYLYKLGQYGFLFSLDQIEARPVSGQPVGVTSPLSELEQLAPELFALHPAQLEKVQQFIQPIDQRALKK